MSPAARVGDLHRCPLVTPVGAVEVPHVGGPILPPGAFTVLIGGRFAATVGTWAECTGAPELPDAVVEGSATVWMMGRPAARRGDRMEHGGTITSGSDSVFIGG